MLLMRFFLSHEKGVSVGKKSNRLSKSQNFVAKEFTSDDKSPQQPNYYYYF